MVHDLSVQGLGIQQVWTELIQLGHTKQPHRRLNLIPHD
jgi:hypothetical protein